MLGGGVLVTANVFASATEGDATGDPGMQMASPAAQAMTVDCPDVGNALTSVPEGARENVDKELAALDGQIAEAYQRLKESSAAQQQDAAFADNAILGPLKDKRAATIARILDAIDQEGDRPQGVDGLAACSLRAPETQSPPAAEQPTAPAGGQSSQGAPGDQGGGAQGGQGGNGPVAADYADIMSVPSDAPRSPRPTDASPGTFTSDCGVNAGGLFNSDNIIVAPGVTNGAHHFHDYVGNQANNGLATIDDLAKAETSCQDQGDRSSYYWPVLRLQNGTVERDAEAPGGGTEGNAGQIVTPEQVTLTFVGNPLTKVTPMPRLLRIITGDAKAFVNGPANANASWSCTGHEDRQLKDKYPLCPDGSDVVRTFRFQSCWDGRNVDSANHRTHVAFADPAGNCPQGFVAIPQLVQRIVYDVDAPSLADGGRSVPLFAVDSFPENLHKPITDHGDFINIFDEKLMREAADCINEGRTCGAGEQPSQEPSDEPPASEQPPASDEPPASQEPTDQPPASDEPTSGAGDATGGNGNGNGNGGNGGQDAGDNGNDGYGTDSSAGAPQDGQPGDDAPAVPGTVTPKADPAPPATQDATDNPAAVVPEEHHHDHQSAAATAGETPAAVPAPSPAGQAGQQEIGGGLADTGADLWPAALGAVLAIAGFVLLRSVKRGSR
ncbi:DUF1996 domain-containing protein [Streptomyces sp. MI02-7b]|uniref:DUF1996 domain-containing protein n=1 Tax=Streptomyces sp. MI02-7b TaxID=462941 RepID=UPI0029B277FB|nr:DUF1996 domain-containing protein [Streptomyces sp. MI02-7b]MDX3072559.1 DUF1996 domain-containing protein [Streptomyces sp. MI02-7b]